MNQNCLFNVTKKTRKSRFFWIFIIVSGDSIDFFSENFVELSAHPLQHEADVVTVVDRMYGSV